MATWVLSLTGDQLQSATLAQLDDWYTQLRNHADAVQSTNPRLANAYRGQMQAITDEITRRGGSPISLQGTIDAASNLADKVLGGAKKIGAAVGMGATSSLLVVGGLAALYFLSRGK